MPTTRRLLALPVPAVVLDEEPGKLRSNTRSIIFLFLEIFIAISFPADHFAQRFSQSRHPHTGT